MAKNSLIFTVLFAFICINCLGQHSSLIFKPYHDKHADSASYYYLKDHRNISGLELNIRKGYLISYGSLIFLAGMSTVITGALEMRTIQNPERGVGPGTYFPPDPSDVKAARNTTFAGVPFMIVGPVLIGLGAQYAKIDHKVKVYEATLSHSPEDLRTMRRLRINSILLHTFGNVTSYSLGTTMWLGTGLGATSIGTPEWLVPTFASFAIAFTASAVIQIVYGEIMVKKYSRVCYRDL